MENKLLIAIVAGLVYTIGQWRLGNGVFPIVRRPLTMAFICGLLMGNMQDAMIMGCYLTLAFLGIVVVGGNLPSDVGLASAVAIPVALATGQSPEMALVIATPFSVIGVFIDQLRRIINGFWVTACDKHAEELDHKGIARCVWLYTFLTNFVLRFPTAFALVYFGTDAVDFILNNLPAWVTNGFSVAGGVLPAFGFALTLIVIGKKSLYPFFFIGFFATKLMGLSTIYVAAFAIPFVIAVTLKDMEKEKLLLNKFKLTTTLNEPEDE